MIVATSQKGPIRTVIEAYGGALAIFSPPQQTRAKKIALRRGGVYWVAVWMMRRFSKYAYFLGHRNGRRWNNIKRRQLQAEPIPFYGLTPPGGGPAAPGYTQVNGAKMKDAVRAATVTSVGISGRESVTIRVPYGHPIRTEDSNAFKRLPQREIGLIAKEIGEEMARIIASAQPVAERGSRRRAPPELNGPRMRLGEKYAAPRRTRTGGQRRVG